MLDVELQAQDDLLMAEVRCVDGSRLTVLPVPVLDREGVPYEVTLEMRRDGEPFGEVGERCGFFLATTAARLRGAREAGLDYPADGLEAGVRAWAADEGLDQARTWQAVQRYLPRDRELFAFRSRDPDDVAASGELRVALREERSWLPATDGPSGRGRLDGLAVLTAWGAAGTGVRAVLDSAGLLALLDALLADCASVGAVYPPADVAEGLRRPVG